jgi:ATP-binding cassette, subfamily B, bacterial
VLAVRVIDGRDVRTVTQRSLRRHIGAVMQDPLLFDDSIAANIAYGRPEASAAEIEAAARGANAPEFIMKLPHGYDSAVGQRGVLLSAGQRQRIAIARVLLKDPPSSSWTRRPPPSMPNPKRRSSRPSIVCSSGAPLS